MNDSFFETIVKNVCGEYLAPSDYEIYNGTLFYTAPLSVSRKIFSNLMMEFNGRCTISRIEMDSYAVDFVA
jgi:hypothetical protein